VAPHTFHVQRLVPASGEHFGKTLGNLYKIVPQKIRLAGFAVSGSFVRARLRGLSAKKSAGEGPDIFRRGVFTLLYRHNQLVDYRFKTPYPGLIHPKNADFIAPGSYAPSQGTGNNLEVSVIRPANPGENVVIQDYSNTFFQKYLVFNPSNPAFTGKLKNSLGAQGFGFRSQTSCLLPPARGFALPAPSMAPFPPVGRRAKPFESLPSPANAKIL
jgi:hypothetical protein